MQFWNLDFFLMVSLIKEIQSGFTESGHFSRLVGILQ